VKFNLMPSLDKGLSEVLTEQDIVFRATRRKAAKQQRHQTSD
jgi:hypothetical protein